MSSLALIALSIAASILQSVPILATLGAALWLGRSVGWAVGAQFYVRFFWDSVHIARLLQIPTG